MLSRELLQQVEELGRKNELDETVNSLEKYAKFYIPSITIPKEIASGGDSKGKGLGTNALKYIQLLLYRSKTLTEGSIHALNTNCPLSAVLSVRAHYETTGAIAYLLNRLSSCYDGNIDRDRLDRDMKKLMLGSKVIEIAGHEIPDPVQVMNLIDAADDYLTKVVFKKSGEESPQKDMFREFYGHLCEYCHPNFEGLISGSKIIPDGENLIIYFPETGSITKYEYTIFFYINMSIMIFFHCYEEVLNLLKKNETMPYINDHKGE